MSNINDIVTINATILTQGVLAREFGITLFVTPDTTLQSSERMKTYADLTDVAQDFSITSEPYKAAKVYFAQDPFPKNLIIGRWFDNDVPANVLGGAPAALATLTAINDGTFAMNGINVVGMDFTTALSYTDIATVIQTQAVAAGLSITCSYNATKAYFEIFTTAVGSSATLTYASPAGSGTDVSGLLAMSSTTATQLNQGVSAELISTAMDQFVSINNTFYFITFDATQKDTAIVPEISTWTIGKSYFFFAESSDPNALIIGDITSEVAQLFAQGSSRTATDWTPATSTNPSLVTDYLSVSSAARLSSINFNAPNSLINPKFKARPTIEPAILTTSQSTELKRKLANFYTTIGGDTVNPTLTNIYQEGTTCSPAIYQDIRYGFDWLINSIQNAVLQALLENDRIPQTDEGQALLKSVIEVPLQQGVNNSLLAPGNVSQSTKSQIVNITGNQTFDGFLTSGYLVYPLPASSLTPAQRTNREAPLIYVWATGSGAVNFVTINLELTP